MKTTTCAACGGDGKIQTRRGERVTASKSCDECNGSGHTAACTCQRCTSQA